MALNNLVMRLAVDLFFNDDSDDENSTALCKIYGFAEEIVPKFSDRQFQSHFRMTPTTFDNLYGRLRSLGDNIRLDGNPQVPLEKQLMITIWYLSNIGSFRGVADRFGISRSTAWMCFYRICQKLLQFNRRFKIISFPNDEKCQHISEAFRHKTGFPGVVGVVDGSHIPILAPKHNHASYVNRKGYHSVLLQAVCDDKKMFLHCYAGEAGSVHDSCVFRRSHIDDRFILPPEMHLLGDSAYTQTTKLLIPFRNNGHLNEIQKNYNKKHSQTRVIIENSFALLKGRFRRMKLLEAVRSDHIPLIIVCACILHNVCISMQDIPFDINLEQEVDEERVMNPPELVLQDGRNGLAVDKRNDIANTLYYEALQL